MKASDKGINRQFFIGIIIIVISLIVFGLLWKFSKMMACCWIVGISIGAVLRFSRFCFASSFRDVILAGNTKLLRAVIIAMMISSVGFAIIQGGYLKGNAIVYNQIPGAVTEVGLHVVIGAFVFGIGMVIAGGCGSSVLMRLGEGHMLYVVVFIGFLIGTLWGAKDYGFWYDLFIKNSKAIYFPEYVDIKVVALLQLTILSIVYACVYKYERKNLKDCLKR